MYYEEYRENLDKYNKLCMLHSLGNFLFVIPFGVVYFLWHQMTSEENMTFIVIGMGLITFMLPAIIIALLGLYPSSFDVSQKKQEQMATAGRVVAYASGSMVSGYRFKWFISQRNWKSMIYPFMNIIGVLFGFMSVVTIAYEAPKIGLAYIVTIGIFFLYQSISIHLCSQWQKYNHLYIYGNEEESYGKIGDEEGVKRRKGIIRKIGTFFWILPFIIYLIAFGYGVKENKSHPMGKSLEESWGESLDKNSFYDYEKEEESEESSTSTSTSTNLKKLQESNKKLKELKESMNK